VGVLEIEKPLLTAIVAAIGDTVQYFSIPFPYFFYLSKAINTPQTVPVKMLWWHCKDKVKTNWQLLYENTFNSGFDTHLSNDSFRYALV
jgi:hypothetical protein